MALDPNAKAKSNVMRRADYTPYEYEVDKTSLDFTLDKSATIVKSKLEISRNPKSAAGPGADMVLDGEDMKLKSVKLDGRTLQPGEYSLDDEKLVIHNPPENFTLEIENEIDPAANTKLMGLYISDGVFCTQCEPGGFRRITYYPDRPDVMSEFDVTVRAPKDAFPVLLSNGNEVNNVEYPEQDGSIWHESKYVDPHRKPGYLFALVGSDHDYIEDTFTTMSGRDVTLRIYGPQGDTHKFQHAMEALKHAMKWDEEAYGREYDLDIFNVVGVSDFNFGAMENKSLNIYNASLLYATGEEQTDAEHVRVETVIGHEYFHNWSGNRVTLQNMFELSLKEGFTVRRDHEFGEAMFDPEVQRIEQVEDLRFRQFSEDAGTGAHPVRLEETESVSNFYTATIYEKGNELIRMMKTIIGDDAYRAGSDLFFDRHDGQAVTIDDFVAAMEDASGHDLSAFKKWYAQSGTPEVTAKGTYDAASQTYRLELSQVTKPTLDQPTKDAMVIPVKLGLIGDDGKDMPLTLKGENPATPGSGETERVIILDGDKQVFEFTGVKSAPVPSLFRGFSAPVKVETDVSNTDLAFQMANDSDGFNRYEASQTLVTRAIYKMVDQYQNGQPLTLDKGYIEAVRGAMLDATVSDGLKAKLLSMPTQAELVRDMPGTADPDAVAAAHSAACKQLGAAIKKELVTTYSDKASLFHHKPFVPYKADAAQMAERSLKNAALSLFAAADRPSALSAAYMQYDTAENMTDRMAAMSALLSFDRTKRGMHNQLRDDALADFENRFGSNMLVMNKWFAAQARAGSIEDMEKLTQRQDFVWTNPNRVRSVFTILTSSNPEQFHRADGKGYKFVADAILKLEDINPAVGARFTQAFTQWPRFDKARQDMMKDELKRIRDTRGDKLSANVRDIINKALKDDAKTPVKKPQAKLKGPQA